MQTTIDRIEFFLLSAPLREPIGNAARFFDRRDTLAVKITTRAGVVGWGETWGLPASAAALIEKLLGPAIIGEDVRYPQKIWRKLARFIVNDRRGLTHMAISALDMAVWDASARHEGVPLSAKLGGALRDTLTCYVSGPFVRPGPDPYGHYRDEVASYRETGFRNVKIRAGIGAREDAAIVARLRDMLGPDIGLMVDFNEAGDVAQAEDFARRISDCDIVWLEEPVLHDDLPAWKRLAGNLPLALAGGESLYGTGGFRDYFAAGVFSIAQPDLALCGGVTEALRIAALAEAFNVPVAPHVWGGAINFAASLHFAAVLPDRSRPGRRYPFFEYDTSYNPLRSMFAPCALLEDGTVAVPRTPGLGLDIEENELRPFIVARGALEGAKAVRIQAI